MKVRPEITSEDRALLQREGLDTLEGAFSYAGGEELSKPGLGHRRRYRLDLTDDAGRSVRWYLKRYGRQPWPKRLRLMLTGGGYTSPARREAEAVSILRAAGAPTMDVVAFGDESGPVGARRSYIVVTAVPGDALERCLADCLERWDDAAAERFNAALLDIVCRLHLAGAVHRDLYASHVFVEEAADGPRLYLIDVARVFLPRWRRFRWRAKDLAQLKYSMPSPWVAQYWGGFLGGYLARVGGDIGRWSDAIDRKVASMRRRHSDRERRH